MQTLTRQDLSDILYGAAILGTGGGGELSEGFALIDDALAKGKAFTLVGLDEVPDDALVCTPYLLGAISPLPEAEERQYNRLPRIDEHPILLAYRRFERYLGRRFYGTISCELGGSNTACAFYAAAMNGGYILDADPAGRAVPEITHSTYYISGLPAEPIMMANEFGECILCENVIDDLRAESVVRALAMVSRNDIAAIDHALEMSELRDAVIPGAISMAWDLGRAWRKALEAGADVAEAVAARSGGAVAFRGTIGTNDWSTRDGFTFGSFEIEGRDHFEGHRYQVELKNENLVARLNGEVHVTIPDLICMLDTDTGVPVTNPNYRTGQNVAVILVHAPEAFTSPKGLEAFGPNYAGLDQPYRPFSVE
ncbi:DUF917 domain-containing protein [Tropicimonas sp. TH_r6]|uniref:DUF917 domain-containing protein n=1 Tax=Tropicimonas sp. TH_r6 TaxID=3082085 RepID=UPI002954EDB2|nr:DUF917 domain-containing protein [Tropicimonas sp. TH_r6]MDV7145624.1 DUF917 domain-containing protein [Tropicimonas sp. TH_r6]